MERADFAHLVKLFGLPCVDLTIESSTRLLLARHSLSFPQPKVQRQGSIMKGSEAEERKEHTAFFILIKQNARLGTQVIYHPAFRVLWLP